MVIGVFPMSSYVSFNAWSHAFRLLANLSVHETDSPAETFSSTMLTYDFSSESPSKEIPRASATFLSPLSISS